MSLLNSLIALTLVASTAPTLAQTVATVPAKKAIKDPNRQICQRIEETGSRLGAKKVCMTVAEWSAQRQADKDLTDKIQSQSYKPQ